MLQSCFNMPMHEPTLNLLNSLFIDITCVWCTILIIPCTSNAVFILQALPIHCIQEPCVLGLGTFRSSQSCSSPFMCHEEDPWEVSGAWCQLHRISAASNLISDCSEASRPLNHTNLKCEETDDNVSYIVFFVYCAAWSPLLHSSCGVMLLYTSRY